MGFAELDEAAQVAVLQRAAAEAAAAFGLEGATPAPVLLAYNATFRLDVADASYAMRILVGSSSTAEHIAAQQSWQLALAADAGVAVPVPLPTLDGAWWVGVPSAALGRTAVATVASWLDGMAVGGSLDAPLARALGAAMARMHVHAATWTMPPGAALPTFDDVLFGVPDVLGDVDDLSGADRSVLEHARERAQAVLARLHARGGARPLHADLHAGNLLRSGDDLQILDFDDAGLGVPALDLAIARFYADDPALHAALADGYASVAPLPAATEEDLHALAAGRQLLLANDMLRSTSATLRADARGYLDTSVRRLGAWLDTGRFTRAIG